MSESARYVKIIEWSDEDGCYVGSAPDLLYAGCHGDDEREVFEELCRIVDETIELYHKDGKPLPPPTSGRDLANSIAGAAEAWSLNRGASTRRCPVAGASDSSSCEPLGRSITETIVPAGRTGLPS